MADQHANNANRGHALATLTFREALATLASAGRQHPPLVCVAPETSVRDTLALLAQHRILSVPVVARAAGGLSPAADGTVPAEMARIAEISNLPVRSRYAGVVGVLDLVGLLVAQAANPEASLGQPVENAMPLALGAREEAYRAWERDVDDTLAETLAQFARGTHRALLTSVVLPADAAKVFTQSDVARLVAHQPQLIEGLVDLDTPLQDLLPAGRLVRDARHPLFVATKDMTAQAAFREMFARNVSALPVVGAQDDNILLAGISAASLRGVDATQLRAQLDLPVLEFLKATTADGHIPEPEICTPTMPLRVVLAKIVANALHRVWVVHDEADRHCLGVVTLTDVLKILANAMSGTTHSATPSPQKSH